MADDTQPKTDKEDKPLTREDVLDLLQKAGTSDKLDLSRRNLQGIDLREIDLSGAKLSGVDLSGAKLSGTDLSGAKLSGAKLSGAKLSGAKLSGVDLTWADLTGAKLSGANLTGVDLPEASEFRIRTDSVMGTIAFSVFDLYQIDFPLTRYTDIRFPEKLHLGQQAMLEVNLTLEENKLSRTKERFNLSSLSPVMVNITPSPGLSVLSDSLIQPIELFADKDSNPVSFILQAQSEGEQVISLSFWQNGKFAKRVEVSVQVVHLQPAITLASVSAETSEPLIISSRRVEGQLVGPDSHTKPADVQIYINTFYSPTSSKTVLNFTVDYFDGTRRCYQKSAGQLELNGDPRSKLSSMFEQLTKRARNRTSKDPAKEDLKIQRELKCIGENLYADYFPSELRKIFREFRSHAQTMLIISNEPWIPWEIAYIYDEEASEEEQKQYEGFLCDKFIVSRWLSIIGLIGRLKVSNTCCVVPNVSLAAASREFTNIQELSKTMWKFNVSNKPLATKDEVLEKLEQDKFNVMHFICHGLINKTNPDHSSLTLDQGEMLSPKDIIGVEIERNLKKLTPIFFLNACHSGMIDFELVKLGGWAERLIRTGCSAFVGALWEVNDKLAASQLRWINPIL